MKRLLTLLCLTLLAACQPGGPSSPPVIGSFTATPASLPIGGGNTTLTWEASSASSLTINQGVGAVTPTDKGSKSVAVAETKTFTLTASNNLGSVSKDVSVTVALPLSISITPTSRAFVAGSPGGSFDANVTGSTATVNWSLTGPGSLSSATGPSVIYTPPPTLTVLTNATLTAELSGTGLSATANISIAPTVLSGGVLFYKSDGSGSLGALDAGGSYTPIKTFAAGDLPAGVTLTGKPYDLYELFYNPDGSGALGSFDGAGNFRRLRAYTAGELPAGQNQLVSFGERVVFYKASTGTTLCGTYGDNYDFSKPVTQTGYSTDWNFILRANDANGAFFYRKSTGTGGYGTYDAACKWSFSYANSGYTTNWSHILRTPNGVLFYRDDGIGALVTYAANGTPTQTGTYLAGRLAAGWEQVVNTKHGVLFYKADGSGELSTFNGNTYTRVKSYAAGELPTNAALVAQVGN
ncbi:hypothetical protein [uncultured Meiothermus sp.]|jgi:hypothetical protein|uniref:hypothetical protein n=1 Tax=uncultured Meiothermus sp. TaxID=157471 RepID=UPI00263418A5|nr:hypothetical protein [uncultured Meiothermus sp.]